MKALIIAAGNGTRLKPKTDNLPKPLVSISGRPLIERVILEANKAGINEFVIVKGYLGDKLSGSLSHLEDQGIKINWVKNDELEKPNGLSVFKAKDLLNEEFILLMSDHLFESDIVKDIMDFKLNENECVLCTDKRLNEVNDINDATKVYIKDGKIVEINKNLTSFNAIDCGIFKCSPIIFKALEKSISNKKYALSDGIRLLAKENKVHSMDVKGRFWQDIDTLEDLNLIEQNLPEFLREQLYAPIINHAHS